MRLNPALKLALDAETVEAQGLLVADLPAGNPLPDQALNRAVGNFEAIEADAVFLSLAFARLPFCVRAARM